jgi:putative spermidine/putrescine transport system permease protein
MKMMLRSSLAAAVITLALGPLLLLMVWSFARGWYWPALWPREWSGRAWAYVFSPAADVLSSLGQSLSIAVVVTLLSLGVAVPAARALAWQVFRAKSAVLFALLVPVLAPPLAATMGMHGLFLRTGLADTWLGVVLVHLIPTVPYATLMLAGSFSRLDPDMEAQARTLGANRLAVWRYVTFPALAPGLAVAASFAFLISWSQYLSTLLVGGGRIITLPLTLVAFQRSGDEAVTAALSLVFLAPTLLIFAALARFLRQPATTP